MKYIAGIIFILLFGACQSDKPTSENNEIKLFTDLYVRYLKNEQQMKAEASFKRGLSIKKAEKVDFEGEIKLNDNLLTPIKIKDAIFRYQLSKDQAFKSQYNFTFLQDNGIETAHSIKMLPIEKFNLTEGVASKEHGFQLNWDGADLTAQERLLVMITDKNSKAHSISVRGPSQSQSVTIKGADLEPLDIGNGYIYLVRKQESAANQQNMAFSALSEFYTDRILIDITE